MNINFNIFLPETSNVPPPKSKTRTICLDLNRVREERKKEGRGGVRGGRWEGREEGRRLGKGSKNDLSRSK